MQPLPCYVSTSSPLAPRSPWWQRCGSPRRKASSCTSGSKTSSYTSGSKAPSFTSVDAHTKTKSPITSLATPKRGSAAQSPVFKSPSATNAKQTSNGERQDAFNRKDECHVTSSIFPEPLQLEEKTAENQDKIERWLHRQQPLTKG
jgi:hypothetical protein